MRTKIVVTGAFGFIGSSVVRRLVKRKNIDLHCVVSPHSEAWRLKSFGKRIYVHRLDLAKEKIVDVLFKKIKPDMVIHLATHGVYSYQQGNVKRIVEDNFMMASNLLEASKKYNVKRFINTGSVFEYGSQAGKMKEEDVDISDILNKYSAVKMATTALANSYKDDFKVITIRPFTAYGPHGDKSRFVTANILRALKNEPIRIVDGVARDFVYVDDVASGFVKALTVKIDSGEIVNLGSGKKHSLKEVVSVIKKLTESNSKVVIDKEYKRDKESKCWANIGKAKKILNWSPKHGLVEGIGSTISWVRQNY